MRGGVPSVCRTLPLAPLTATHCPRPGAVAPGKGRTCWPLSTASSVAEYR